MKWSLKSLKVYLTSRYGADAVTRLFHDIQMVVLKSLLAVQSVVVQDKHAFELYGYDVMIDEQLRPWLIEARCSGGLLRVDNLGRQRGSDAEGGARRSTHRPRSPPTPRRTTSSSSRWWTPR